MFYVTAGKTLLGVAFSATTEDDSKCAYARP
jgi:hypothetical protein